VTVSQKAALSLLISAVLAVCFSVLAFTGFFNLIETRFYNPSIISSLEKEIQRDADAIQDFLDESKALFSAPLETDAVKRSFLPNQAAQDILERTRVYGVLMESRKGLQSVRFIDAGGLRIRFSTNPADILSQNDETVFYKNYDETAPYVPYSDLAVSSGGSPRITLDQQNERIVFSFPFYDSMKVYRGTAIYSLSVRAVTERLIAKGGLKIGENLSIVSDPPGMVSGLTGVFSETRAVIDVVSSVWKERFFNITVLDSVNSGSSLMLVSAKTNQGLLVGRLVDETLFSFPQSMKVILLSAIFLTLFLSIFLALNLRPDTLTTVQNRLKNLQLSLIQEYYEHKGEMDWNRWHRELEQRRGDVRAELKRGIKETSALSGDIDGLIDKSWDEILAVIGGKHETKLVIDEDKLQIILSRALKMAGNTPALQASGGGLTPAVSQLAPGASGQANESDRKPPGMFVQKAAEDDPEEVEELGEELEELEEFDETEEPDVDAELEELEELEDPEDAEEPETVSPDDVASKIEFEETGRDDDDFEPNEEFVIISPFTSMFSKLDDQGGFKVDDDDGKRVKTSGRLEELDGDYSLPVIYKPFQNEDRSEPQELPSVASGIIKQRNGVNYVDKKAKQPDSETAKSLDAGLKNLVDSVIGKE